MIPLLRLPNGQTMAFMADLLPSTGHIPLAYVMGYDTRPLLTLDEKRRSSMPQPTKNGCCF